MPGGMISPLYDMLIIIKSKWKGRLCVGEAQTLNAWEQACQKCSLISLSQVTSTVLSHGIVKYKNKNVSALTCF